MGHVTEGSTQTSLYAVDAQTGQQTEFLGYLKHLKIKPSAFVDAVAQWEQFTDDAKAAFIRNYPRRTDIDYEWIISTYNCTCVNLPPVHRLSEDRKKTIRARFNNGYTYEDFDQLFQNVEASGFLKGENDRGWKANFDWLIRDANMAKVLDGNYQDKQERQRADSSYNLSELEKIMNRPIADR